MVFAFTRIIFIPQCEFVTFGALTLAFIINGRTPGTLWLLLIVGVVVAIKELYHIFKYAPSHKTRRLINTLGWSIGWGLIFIAQTHFVMGYDDILFTTVFYVIANDV